MKSKRKLIIHEEPPRPERMTHVIDLRIAFKGHRACAEDNSYLQELLDRVREVGAAEVVREGNLFMPFNEWTCQQLREAKWEDEK